MNKMLSDNQWAVLALVIVIIHSVVTYYLEGGV